MQSSRGSALIQFKERVFAKRGEPLYLHDVCHLSSDKEVAERLHELILYTPHKEDGNYLLMEILWVMEQIKVALPDIEVDYVGSTQLIIEMKRKQRRMHSLFVVLVWILLFLGSGMAVMNFHTDVSMPDVHRKLYQLIMGEKVERPLLLQIPYSLGIGIGMILFFNHLLRRRINDEPSPLEVEMFLYDENVKQFLEKNERPIQHREK